MLRLLLGLCSLLALLTTVSVEGRPVEAKPDLPYIAPEGVEGTLFLVGGGQLPESVRAEFVKRAGGDKGKLVLVTSTDNKATGWDKAGLEKVTVLQLSTPSKTDNGESVKLLQDATAVWFADKPGAAVLEPTLAKELAALQKRGGVVGGLDSVPGAITERGKDRLLAALGKHPNKFGIGIDEETALVVKGRAMRALGKGKVTLMLPAAGVRPVRVVELQESEKAGNISDLTSWRRAARERNLDFPPREVPPCEVASGSLVIVGGGGMPADVTNKFIELAGGPEALIVVLPLAEGDGPPSPNQGGFFTRAGAKNVVTLPARRKGEVEDPKNLEVLRKAKGLWFGGGRQWRFVDGYENTQALPLFHDVLRRGGVIGGSSAGASIQGDYLCRANPLGNLDIMAEGYERGFAFLPGSAIDQHFKQRNRFPNMTSLMQTFPQYLGIGLDEATAIVVKGSVAEVMGRGETHFYDGRTKPAEGEKDHVSLKAGQAYDVKARKAIEK